MISVKPGMFRVLRDVCAGKDVFLHAVRTARDVMSTDLKCLTIDDTIEAALKLMKQARIRHLPVLAASRGHDQKHGETFVGIVSQRDLFRMVSPFWGTLAEPEEDGPALGRRLVEIVTRDPASVRPETPLVEVLQIMSGLRVDCVPVFSDEELLGLVTTGNVVSMVRVMGTLRQFHPASAWKALCA